MRLKSVEIKKILFVMLILLSASVFLAGCAKIDVVSKYSKESFNKIAKDRVKEIAEGAKKGFEMSSTAGDVFGISYIKSAEKDTGTVGLEIYEIVDAKPFLDAGLNVDRLISEVVYYDAQNNKLVIKKNLNNIKKKDFSEEKAKTISGLYDMMIDANREILGYHEKLGHFGLSFGEGYMLEWAKDMTKNEKDIVWVLDPTPLVSAGLNPDSIESWTYTKVPVMDKDGRKLEVEKFLRAYNLE